MTEVPANNGRLLRNSNMHNRCTVQLERFRAATASRKFCYSVRLCTTSSSLARATVSPARLDLRL